MNEGVRTCETVMLLVVSVPVLSEQMTSAQPRASTVGSLRTTALRRAIRTTPKASVTVTTMGRPCKQCCQMSDCPLPPGNPAYLGDGRHGEADAHVEHVEDGPPLDAAHGHDDGDDDQGGGGELGEVFDRKSFGMQ